MLEDPYAPEPAPEPLAVSLARFRRAVRWWVLRTIMVAVIAIFLAGAIRKAFAEPIYQYEGSGVVIVLHDEECEIEAVTNLAGRLTWTQDEETIEACWGVDTVMALVLVFRGDGAVLALPVQVFKRLTPA